MCHVAPPSRLIWTLEPASSCVPSEPWNTSVLSLVMKSVALTPVSSVIESIERATIADVSITTFWMPGVL